MNDDNRFDVRMRQMVKNYQDHVKVTAEVLRYSLKAAEQMEQI